LANVLTHWYISRASSSPRIELPAPPLFSFKGYPLPGKQLPNTFYPVPVHSCPLRYRFIGISLVGKQQRLCPLPFSGAVFAPIDDCRKPLPFRFGQRYPVFFLKA
jgi:hypothetical protein